MSHQAPTPGGFEPPFSWPDSQDDHDEPPARLEGSSFPVTIKVLATLWMAAMGVYMVLGWDSAVWVHLGWGGRGFLLAALGVVFSGYYGILTSRTSFDGHTIEQTWIWSKQVTLPEITQVKLIQVRGLEWLIVPRLVVRRGSLGLMTFHAADPRVLAGFRALAYGPQ